MHLGAAFAALCFSWGENGAVEKHHTGLIFLSYFKRLRAFA